MPKKLTLVLLGFLLAPFIASFSVGYFFLDVMNKGEQGLKGDAVETINKRLEPLINQMNDYSRSVSADILFLGKLSCLKNGIDDENYAEPAENFIAFMKQHQTYFKLEFLDVQGNEKMEVVSTDGEPVISQVEGLFNKKDEEYFQKTISLEEAEVYVSKLELNKTKDVLENRGTKESPQYVPVIRYATPIVSSNGDKQGILVATVYADSFLEEIRRSSRSGEAVSLISNDGYYLANAQKSKEFADLLENSVNFFTDYSGVKEALFDRYDRKSLEKDGSLFTFHYIYPTLGSFEINKGAEKIFGKNPENNYYWTLVSVSDKNELANDVEKLRSDYFTFIFLTGGISVLVIFGAFVVILRIYKKDCLIVENNNEKK